MEYDRHVAILQGSILGFEKGLLSENEKCVRLSKVLRSISTDNTIIYRKIFMCVLLNTNIKEIELLREINEYAPLSDLFRISSESFIKLLDEKLWTHLVEAIPCVIPLDVLDIIVGLLVNPESTVHLTIEKCHFMQCFTLIVAVISRIKQTDEEVLAKSSMVKNLLALIDLFKRIVKDEDKLESKLFGTLFLLKTACSKDQDALNKSLPGSLLFHKDLSIPLMQSHIKECPQEVIKSILSIYTNLAKDITLEIWLDLTEIKTDTIKYMFNEISIWDLHGCIPSNLQMLLAHFTFQIKEYLSETTLSDPEALQILNTFSKEYNRKMELQLESMTVNDIISKLNEYTDDQYNTSCENDDNWKILAYCEFLLSQMWDEIMGKVKHFSDSYTIKWLQTLTKKAVFLVDYSDKIYYELVVSKEKSSIWETKLKLFLGIFKHLTLTKSKRMLDIRLKEHGVHSPVFLVTQHFYHEIRNFLNKIVIKENNTLSDGLTVEMYQLIFQSPKEVIFYLIQEGLENKGKVDVVTKVLCMLPKSIVHYLVESSNGNVMLITSALVLKLIVIRQSTSEQDIINFYIILNNIFQSDSKIAKDVSLHLIKSCEINFIAQTINVFRLAFDVIDIETLSYLEKTVFMINFCQIASFLYKTDTIAIIQEDLSSILTILDSFSKHPATAIYLNENIVHDFLTEDLHGYIINNTSSKMELRDILKSTYFKQEKITYSSDIGIKIEIAACLPQLLPIEWNNLGHLILVNNEKIPIVDILESVHILISTNVLEAKQLQYVLKSLGKLLSSRIQEMNREIDNRKYKLWIENILSKLCQVIGKFN